MDRFLHDKNIRHILTPHEEDEKTWRSVLDQFRRGEKRVTRKSAGEGAIKAIQRLLIFLGYSTSSSGAFSIDGDFGRGTNRAVAQFEFDHQLNSKISRKILCYPCTWQTARSNIRQIPETRLTVKTMTKMLAAAQTAIKDGAVLCGNLKEALFQLDSLNGHKFLNCRGILKRYGKLVDQAVSKIHEEKDIRIQPEWILAIIRQETAGVVRPRFEQHILTRLNNKQSRADLIELRYQAMSQGLGQILGSNYKVVGAKSAITMFQSPLEQQVLFVARFLAKKPQTIGKRNPTKSDFERIARYYNGPGFAKHHYDERIERWFREFRQLRAT